ncbi:MAG: ATP:cob(I)alamin adenosyltransferase [Archaeoglobaceae archaeon]
MDVIYTTDGSGKCILKSSDEVSAIGAIDEANSFIGIAKIFSKREEVKKILSEVQKLIFKVGGEISGYCKVNEDVCKRLSEFVEFFEAKVEKPRCFLILEKDEATAFLSAARAVVRRAEREAVKLYLKGKISKTPIIFLNKLSYLLYLATLYEGDEFEKI